MDEYERGGGGGGGGGGAEGGGDQNSLSHLFKCAAIAERGGLMHDTLHDISEKYQGGSVFKETIDDL